MSDTLRELLGIAAFIAITAIIVRFVLRPSREQAQATSSPVAAAVEPETFATVEPRTERAASDAPARIGLGTSELEPAARPAAVISPTPIDHDEDLNAALDRLISNPPRQTAGEAGFDATTEEAFRAFGERELEPMLRQVEAAVAARGHRADLDVSEAAEARIYRLIILRLDPVGERARSLTVARDGAESVTLSADVDGPVTRTLPYAEVRRAILDFVAEAFAPG
ncbi:hypothetical protein ACO2Q0_20775 [Phenylobacterium sp. VNQ135]|uniref:hypothetical protein n=1 Tax=Phenylobacterium sp. VNQ135 TaxID=3400922 RepID=UPI003C12502A